MSFFNIFNNESGKKENLRNDEFLIIDEFTQEEEYKIQDENSFDESRKLSENYNELDKKYNELNKKYNELNKDYNEINKNYSELNKKFNDLNENHNKLKKIKNDNDNEKILKNEIKTLHHNIKQIAFENNKLKNKKMKELNIVSNIPKNLNLFTSLMDSYCELTISINIDNAVFKMICKDDNNIIIDERTSNYFNIHKLLRNKYYEISIKNKNDQNYTCDISIFGIGFTFQLLDLKGMKNSNLLIPFLLIGKDIY